MPFNVALEFREGSQPDGFVNRVFKTRTDLGHLLRQFMFEQAKLDS